MSDWRSGSSIGVLTARADLLRKLRAFFLERGVLEVETPALSQFPSIDRNLDPLSMGPDRSNTIRYLITSPEYHMKRLLCDGFGSMYQVCKAFREEESGKRHNPEFTILEWYRVGWDHHQLMTEVEDLLQLLLNCGSAERMTYRDLFQQYAGLDPFAFSIDSFLECCRRFELSPPESLSESIIDRNACLDFLMAVLIEPGLGLEGPLLIYDYPATQASLARIKPGQPEVCERFEVFYQGMELGNGFHELADADEQAERFQNENRLRRDAGKPSFDADRRFLDALSHGLPLCSGVAMGFDRIVMLATGSQCIADVVAFPWERS